MGPHYRVRVQPHDILLQVEYLVPGAEVYGWFGGWQRLRKIEPVAYPHAAAWEIAIAYHSGWLLAQVLGPYGILGTPVPRDGCERLETHLSADELLTRGAQVAQAAVERGELLPRILADATPYQLRAAGYGSTRPWLYLVWPPGSGKTPGALLSFAGVPGNVLVVCPASARKEWRARPMTDAGRAERPRTSIEKFSTLEPHVILPAAQAAGGEPLAEYTHRMRVEGRRAVVVVGMESLGAHLNTIADYDYDIVVFDELHDLGDDDRYTVRPTEAGGTEPVERATATGEVKRAMAAVKVSHGEHGHWRHLKLRVGLSGSPLDDGRPRRLRAPLDLLSPGGFGGRNQFRVRYCGATIGKGGHRDDSGESNIEELWARCSFFVHRVQRSEVTLRKLDLEVTYLGKDELNRAAAFQAEYNALLRQRLSPSALRGRVKELRLAAACSMKRKPILKRTGEFLGNEGKVVILMARRALVEEWGADLRKSFPNVTGWTVADGEDGADEAVDAFSDHPGPCWLIGTGYKIGQSKNGMQCAHLGIIAQLPQKPGHWQQWIGRFDRIDGRGTLVWVPIAEGTQDESEASRLTRKFGSVERFLGDPSIGETIDKLDGLDDDAPDTMLAALKAARYDEIDLDDEED